MVEEEINELRECFEEEVTKNYDNEALAWMLFVDGCAILQFIHSFSITFGNDEIHEDQFKKLGIKTHSVVFGQQDLFLLENQLLYRLLERLMSSSQKETELHKSLDDFIDMYIKHPQPSVEQEIKKGKRSTYSPHSQTADHVTIHVKGSPRSHSPNPKKGSSQPTHLLDLLRKKLLELSQPNSSGTTATDNLDGANAPAKKKNTLNGANGQQLHKFGNVQELRAAGIHVKHSGSSSLRDITFDKRFNFYPGHLMFPPIIVGDSTRPKFLNLIAYEMCSDFDNDYGVTSYISLLDSLIDEPNDVRELKKAGILKNFLDSDEEVAKLFNEIGTDLMLDLNPDAYSDVKRQIQKFCNDNCLSRIGLSFHEYVSLPEYFNSRTLWAVIGASLGLGLSLAQVILAALSLPGHDSCPVMLGNGTQNLI